VEAARARVDAAQAQIKSAWARFLPQLHANGSLFARDVAYPTGERAGWQVSVELTVPLYDGGLRYGKLRHAKAALRTAETTLRAEQLNIMREVADAHRDLRVARQRITMAKVRRELATDAAASAKRSYDAGIATMLDVLDANDKLYQADVALANARARVAQGVFAVERALGMSR
jgi:outer membrane protein TolC